MRYPFSSTYRLSEFISLHYNADRRKIIQYPPNFCYIKGTQNSSNLNRLAGFYNVVLLPYLHVPTSRPTLVLSDSRRGRCARQFHVLNKIKYNINL